MYVCMYVRVHARLHECVPGESFQSALTRNQNELNLSSAYTRQVADFVMDMLTSSSKLAFHLGIPDVDWDMRPVATSTCGDTVVLKLAHTLPTNTRDGGDSRRHEQHSFQCEGEEQKEECEETRPRIVEETVLVVNKQTSTIPGSTLSMRPTVIDFGPVHAVVIGATSTALDVVSNSNNVAVGADTTGSSKSRLVSAIHFNCGHR
jgi:hypothetical protein